MDILDNLEEIKRIDSDSLYDSILLFPNQILQTIKEFSDKGGDDIENVVVCGMGGSSLGAKVIDSLVFGQATVPIEVFNEETVPNYVGEKSLVIVSSYSGNTEESVSAYHSARLKKAKLFGITCGGQLLALLEKDGEDYYKIKPANNPSGMPRMGIGYSLTAIYLKLVSEKIILVNPESLRQGARALESVLPDFSVQKIESENFAKKIAKNLFEKIPIFLGSEHLAGVTKTLRNMANENAKSLAFDFCIPEAAHHLLEGLKNPPSLKHSVCALFLESSLYDSKTAKRYALIREIFKKNGVPFSSYSCIGNTRLAQVLEAVSLSAFVSFYLAMLYGVNPTPIPWVDYFKSHA